MKFIIVFAALVACVVGGTIQKAQRVHPKDLPFFGGRIVGGSPASPNQFPHQVSITADSRSFCGGSVIHHSWVLTAAHCTYGMSSFVLGFGHNNVNTPSEKLTAKRVITHPSYNPSTLENDIALLELPKSLNVDGASIRVIRLPQKSQSTETFVGDRSRVSGWGLTSDGGSSISTTMNFVDVKIITNGQCEEVYGSGSIASSTICARGFNKPGDSTCSGDSGGPLILDEAGTWTQIGVVSFVSTRGCSSGDPSGYARTTSFLDWISQHTGIIIRP